MIITHLSYEEALLLPEPKTIWMDGESVIVDTDPQDIVPHEVDSYQARLALIDAGLLDAVNAIITSQNSDIGVRWEYSTKIARNSTNLLSVAAQLGLSETDIDNLFIAAARK